MDPFPIFWILETRDAICCAFEKRPTHDIDSLELFNISLTKVTKIFRHRALIIQPDKKEASTEMKELLIELNRVNF